MNRLSTQCPAANPKIVKLHKTIWILRKQIMREQKKIRKLKAKLKFSPKMDDMARPSTNLEESAWFECHHLALKGTNTAVSTHCRHCLSAVTSADGALEESTIPELFPKLIPAHFPGTDCENMTWLTHRQHVEADSADAVTDCCRLCLGAVSDADAMNP